MADTVAYQPPRQAELEAAWARLHPHIQLLLGVLGMHPRSLPGPMAMSGSKPTTALSRQALADLLQSGPKTPSGPGSLTGLPASRPWVGVKPAAAPEGTVPLNVPQSYAAPKTYDLTDFMRSLEQSTSQGTP